jgi:lipopolysaccharide export system protein LptA
LKNRILYFLIILCFFPEINIGQESKIIEIRKAGGSTQDELKFPGANILYKSKNERVNLFHDGGLIISDKAYFYSQKNSFTAMGNVVFTQGDSLKLICNSINYDGNTRKALASGNVFLKRPDMTLKTDTLYLDRNKNIAYYNTKGVIIDSTTRLSSKRGVYYMNENKYRFLSNVKIVNPDYTIISDQLDYFTEMNEAFLYGKSEIKGNTYEIFCENGFYDMNFEKGFFKKNATIFYDNKIIKGDSLYFENEKEYASASNNVSIIDSINNSIIQGHFGEIFKAKDSAIITKRALAINIIDQDSLYIHADTLITTGPEKHKILRGYYDVRIFKNDLRGKSDSIYLDQSIGLTKLLKKPLTNLENQIFSDVEKNKKNPILWFDNSQMTGDEIFLISNLTSKKLDSLKIIGNAFIIEKDSISENGFNQIQGGILNGTFENGKLNKINITKNTQMIYYLYSDEDQQLIGVNKTTCSEMDISFKNGEIGEITFYVSPNGDVFPDKDLPENERKLKGFIWRRDEKPNSINDLFSLKDENNFKPINIY